MRNIVVDMSNILWAARFAEFKGQNESEFSTSLLMHCAVSHLISFNVKFQPDGILLAFDGRNGWRKDIYDAYKANRQKDMFYEEVNWVADTLYDFFMNHTNITAIKVHKAEADDVIYMATKMSPKTTIISSDTDFVQLLDDKTELYAQTLKTMRTSENPAYDLFIKCIRGDHTDNVMSAFPRVRETKLKEAWEDPSKIKLMNMFETNLPDGRKVGAAYELNKSLIDLTMSPPYIQDAIRNHIIEQASVNKPNNQIGLIKKLGELHQPALARSVSQSENFYNKRFVVLAEIIVKEKNLMIG